MVFSLVLILCESLDSVSEIDPGENNLQGPEENEAVALPGFLTLSHKPPWVILGFMLWSQSPSAQVSVLYIAIAGAREEVRKRV